MVRIQVEDQRRAPECGQHLASNRSYQELRRAALDSQTSKYSGELVFKPPFSSTQEEERYESIYAEHDSNEQSH